MFQCPEQANGEDAMAAKQASGIRVGIGGWTFEPWRETFYPKGLAQKRELEYASRQVTSIEINGTYYGSQKPETFAKWRDETPEGFVLLKEKLGPINWQFLPTKQFDPKDFEAFLKLLPHSVDGHALRHVVEVRHDSFRTPEFIDMLRAHKVAVVLTDKDGFPEIPDVTAPFVYARLQGASEEIETGYAPKALDQWAKRAKAWAEGGAPDDLKPVGSPEAKPPKSRDVFIYMINGFKPKAPAAAMALIKKLG
jgi:uncharacterized protein YecE (DUF72 family)